MSVRDYKILSSINQAHQRIAKNWLVVTSGTLLSENWPFVQAAQPGEIIIWVSIQNQTFPWDNETITKDKVSFRPASPIDQYQIKVKDSQTANLSHVGKNFKIENNIDWTQVVDLTTESDPIEQVKIVDVMDSGKVVVVQIIADVWPQWPKWDPWDPGTPWEEWPPWPPGTPWDPWTPGTPGTPGVDWIDWASIISAEFDDDDIVFTKDDATTVVLEDAKIELKGDKWDQWDQWDQWDPWPPWPPWSWSWDVNWPSWATDDNIAVFDWTTGKIIKDSWTSISEVTDNTTARHTHSNKSILDAIQEAFTTSLKNAYDSVVTWVSTNWTDVLNHIASTSNPHNVTPTQIWLGNVDNTSDADKPVSNATQSALNRKANLTDIADFETTTQLNSRDAANRDRANHTWTQTASTISDFQTAVSSNIDVSANTSARHDAVTLWWTPNYLTISWQVITRALINLASHVTGKLPFANLANWTARSVVGRAWSGSWDVGNISAGNDTVLSRSGSGNVAFNNATTTKTILWLNNVDNTSDLNKPISTATQTALNLKANDNEVVKLTWSQTVAWVKTFSNSPIVPEPTTDSQAATKKYVDDNVWGWGWSVTTLDTLEITWTQYVWVVSSYRASQSWTMAQFSAYLETAPTWSSFIVVLKINWTTQATCTIVASSNSNTTTSFTSATLTEWDLITYEITQIGSSVAWAWLTLALNLS